MTNEPSAQSYPEATMSIKNYDFYYELRSLPFVQAIWLYGSRARGDHQNRSDIDLAIVCPKATENDWRKMREIIDHADTLFAIDCIRFDALTDLRLKKAILENKIILFERKDTSYAWYETFLDLGEAIEKLAEMINEPEHRVSYVREATIQRFEFCVELFWKALKKLCLSEGYEVNSPKATLQRAYAIKLIDDEQIWLDMMEDRNLTSHTYKQSLAREIYQHIKVYYKVMEKTYNKLKGLYNL